VSKLIVATCFLFLTLAGVPAEAQTEGPPPDQAPPAAAGAPPPGAGAASTAPRGGRAAVKALKASCRAQARKHGLAGAALQKSVLDCVGAQRPKVADRMACRQQGTKNGLTGAGLKNFVKTCAAQPQQ
jgi:hypothetical protein